MKPALIGRFFYIWFIMNIEELRLFCLAKASSTEEFPFDEDTLVFKVMGKMFALASLKKWEQEDFSVNVKCDPEYAQELRAKYPEHVLPGYHMHKKHWNTVKIQDTSLTDRLIKHLINHSYDLVVSKLPKKKRELLKENY